MKKKALLSISVLFVLMLLLPFMLRSEKGNPCPARGVLVVKLVDPLEPVFPDSNKLDNYSSVYTLDIAQSAVASVLVAISSPASVTYRVKAVLNGKTLPLLAWAALADVPVEQNTGLENRTEQYSGHYNPYVIRRAPFSIYEPVVPLEKPEIKSINRYTVLRLQMPASLMSYPGKYRINIYVKNTDHVAKSVFNITVHKAKVPLLKNAHFFYTNWFNMSQMEERHRLIRWSAPWFSMLDKYASVMAYGRQNCVNIPGELLRLNKGKIILAEDRMLQFIKIFHKHGFRYFESPHLLNRGSDDDWNDPELKVELTGRRYYTAAAQCDIDTIVRLISTFIKKNNLQGQWMQHIQDEPTKIQGACYRAVVRQVRAIDTSIRIMEAVNDRDSVAGSVDYWCPLVNDFQEHIVFFRKREKLGEHVLVYTCLSPGGKWLNRTLDEERLRQVYFGWAASFYGTMGFLHWGLNQYYVKDPFLQTVIHHFAPGAEANNFLPPGDTHIIYPEKDRPLSAMRFEAHRTGIEDYELLHQLQQVHPNVANKIIKSVFNSYTDYTTCVQLYRKAQKRLLEACDKL